MQKHPSNPRDAAEQRAKALTTAALDCARRLGLSPAETATLLGVPQGVFTAMKKGERTVDGLSDEAERADALVRMTKRLHALLGDEDTKWRSWIRRENPKVGGKPIDLMMRADAIVKLAAYLEKERTL